MRAVKPGHKTILKFRLGLASALALWCAGAGCMMVSYARSATLSAGNGADIKSRSAEWGQASGSGGAHACCKARHASERRVASSTGNVSSSDSPANLEELAELLNSSNAMSCCPLTSGTFVVISRQRMSDDNPTVSRGAEVVSVNASFAATPLAMPLRLPNQNQTYLRGCVFLI